MKYLSRVRAFCRHSVSALFAGWPFEYVIIRSWKRERCVQGCTELSPDGRWHTVSGRTYIDVSVCRVAAVYTETLTLCYQTTRCHVPQDRSVGLQTLGFAAASDRHTIVTSSVLVLKMRVKCCSDGILCGNGQQKLMGTCGCVWRMSNWMNKLIGGWGKGGGEEKQLGSDGCSGYQQRVHRGGEATLSPTTYGISFLVQLWEFVDVQSCGRQ